VQIRAIRGEFWQKIYIIRGKHFIKIRFKPIILYKDSRLKWYKLREIYFEDAIYENEKI
jgi:hypothetical protein